MTPFAWFTVVVCLLVIAGYAYGMGREMRFHWLWSEVYKGLEINWQDRKQLLWLGWTTRTYKRRGW